jgi:S1-C subfamily serine protease
MNTFGVRGGLAVLAITGLFGVAASLRADSKTSPDRAYLGIATEANESGQAGVIVRGISSESPAGKAGLRDGDRIVMAGETAIKTFEDIKNVISAHKPGDKLALKFMREDKEQTLTVTLGKEPKPQARGPEAPQKPGVFLGVFTQPLNANMREHLRIKADDGALVAGVMPGSPAAKAGFMELDVITRLGDTKVTNPRDLRQAIEKAGAGTEVTVQVIRGDKTLDLKARLEEENPRGAFGREGGWRPDQADEFGRLRNRMPPFFADQDKVSALEKKIHELESRIEQLERNQAKPAR